MKTGCNLNKIAWILVIVGALNWGLVGVGMFMGRDLNLVHMILGSMPMIESIVYLLVGVCAVVSLVGCKCATCKAQA